MYTVHQPKRKMSIDTYTSQKNEYRIIANGFLRLLASKLRLYHKQEYNKQKRRTQLFGTFTLEYFVELVTQHSRIIETNCVQNEFMSHSQDLFLY